MRLWSSGTASLRTAVPLDDATRLGLLVDFASNLSRFPGALTAAQLSADPESANASYLARDERRRNRVGRVAAKPGFRKRMQPRARPDLPDPTPSAGGRKA